MRGRTYKYMTGNIYFPFGYGLSYGRIDYSGLSVKADKKSGATVTVRLTNPSKWDVVETAQVYVSAPGAGTTAPLQQLAACKRVKVAAGSRVDVSFDIALEQLTTVQEDGSSKLVRGDYTFTVGGAAPSARTTDLAISQVSAKVKL